MLDDVTHSAAAPESAPIDWARIEAAASSLDGRMESLIVRGDQAPLRDPAAAVESEMLCAAMLHAVEAPGTAEPTLYIVDTSVLALAASAYYLRCELFGPHAPTTQEEARRCVHLFALVHPYLPDDVPEDLRAIVAGAPLPPTRDLFVLQGRFHECFNRASVTGDRTALEAAIGFAREILQGLPASHPGTAMALANLCGALRNLQVFTGSAAELDEAAAVGRESIRLASPDDPDRALYLSNLCSVLVLRHALREQRADLDDAVAYGLQCLDAAVRPHPLFGYNAGSALISRYGLDAVDADLDRACEVLKESARIAEPGDAVRPSCRTTLAVALDMRFKRDRDPADLAAAETEAAGAVADCPPGHPEAARSLMNLGRVLITKARETESAKDFDAAVAAAERATTAALPTGHQSRLTRHLLADALTARGKALHNEVDVERAIALLSLEANGPGLAPLRQSLIDTYVAKFRLSEERADIDTAVTLARQALEGAFTAKQERALALCRLGGALHERSAQFHSADDNEEAVKTLKLARGLLTGGHTGLMRECLTALGAALTRRSNRTRALADIDDGLEARRASVALTPEHLLKPGAASDIGRLLELRFVLAKDTAARDEALQSHRRAERLLRGDDSEAALVYIALANSLMLAYEHEGRLEHLEEANRYFAKADAVEDMSAETRALVASSQAFSLVTGVVNTGTVENLDRAVELARQEVSLTPADHPRRMNALNHLGLALGAQYRATGRPELLDESIRSHRESLVAADPDSSIEVALCLGNLGPALRVRSEQADSAADLEEAIDLARRAVARTPEGHVGDARYRGNLSAALLERFERTPGRADLDEAVEYARSALRLTHLSNPQRIRVQLMVSTALRQRNSSPYRQDGDINEAVAILREAIRDAPPGHPALALAHTNLSVALGTRRIEHPGHRRDGKDAVKAAEAALNLLPDHHPERARALTNLAGAIMGDVGILRASRTFKRANACFREALTVSAAPAQTRFSIARTWCKMTSDLVDAGAGDWNLALEAHRALIAELPRLAWHGLERGEQLDSLGRASGLACDAAAVALNAGRPEEALQLLEQGRGVLVSHALDARGDLSELRERDPALAERIRDLRALLESETDTARFDLDAEADYQRTRAEADRRRELSHELDSLIHQARQLPGLEDFQRLPSIDRLRSSASAGPVVVVNTSPLRCDAFIVTQDQIRTVALPGLSVEGPEGLRARATELLDALEDTGRSPAKTWLAQDLLNGALAWMWKAVAAPVLAELEGEPEDRPLPKRLWWCPTGLLALLPLHAAGTYGADDEPTEALPDRYICSYTTTLRALAAMHGTRRGTEGARLLAVEQAETPGLPPLPRAKTEVARVAGRVSPTTLLEGPRASRAAILDALRDHTVLHFAGHGSQRWNDDEGGALYCHDHDRVGPLTATDISRLRLRHAGLAYLSACETARGTAELPDEALHLSGSLQLAGFAHVVAAQWTVDDAYALAIADDFYTELEREVDGNATCGLEPDHAAVALHRAVQRLRDRAGEPLAWAAYVHTGP